MIRRTSSHDRDATISIGLEVLDSGGEPFSTLRPRDEVEGAGLGLVIAHRVTAKLSGRIEIVSGGRGTLVRVRLPPRPSAARP